MNKEDQGKKIGQIIAKAWGDDAFKQRLMSDASAVLKEEGIDVPSVLEVRAVENTEQVYHLVLPAKPNAELTDEQLDAVAGGSGNNCLWTPGPTSANCRDNKSSGTWMG